MPDTTEQLARAFYTLPAPLEADVLAATRSRIAATSLPIARQTRRGRTHHRIGRVGMVSIAAIALTSSIALATDNPVRSAIDEVGARAVGLFRDPPPEAQPLSPVARGMLEPLAEDDKSIGDKLGTLRPDQGRELASATQGDLTAIVAAAPTSENAVCVITQITSGVGYSPAGSVGCGPLNRDHPFAQGGSSSSDYFIRSGLVMDSVAKMEFRTDRGWIDIPITNGGYIWIAPSPRSRLYEERATLTNGERVGYTYVDDGPLYGPKSWLATGDRETRGAQPPRRTH